MAGRAGRTLIYFDDSAGPQIDELLHEKMTSDISLDELTINDNILG